MVSAVKNGATGGNELALKTGSAAAAMGNTTITAIAPAPNCPRKAICGKTLRDNGLHLGRISARLDAPSGFPFAESWLS
jgi:hypothetical protein